MTEKPSLRQEIVAAVVVGALAIAILYLVMWLLSGIGLALVVLALAMGGRRRYRIRVSTPHLPHAEINVIKRRNLKFWS